MRNILFIGVLLTAACATNPATGKSQISLVSESQEIEMGKQGAAETLASMPIVADSNVQRYVRRVGMELKGVAERPNLPWNFYVLDDAAVNAFAYPGGFIFVTRGILTHMNNEAELAGVLGHEIGHVTARHTAQQITKQQLAQVGLVAGSIISPTIASMAGVASQGLGMLFLKFGRDAEYQADELGFRYMTRDHYDPHAMSSMFTMLQRQSAMGGQGRLPEWESTHPDPENRVAKNEERLKSYQADGEAAKTNRDGFLQMVDGLVFGEDPRDGYFESNVFYHPNFKIRFTFPQGWQTQNMPASVVAVSQQQDALVRLALGKGSPQQALQQFLGQQGVQAGRTSTNPINGLQAATGEFQAQTEQGQVAGLIAFVQQGGTTFQILAYTQAQKYQSMVNTLLSSVQSIAPLTDAAKLNVHPAHVEVVKLTKDMTIDAFYKAFPSKIPFEYVAIINGVEPGALLKAGTSVKQVK